MPIDYTNLRSITARKLIFALKGEAISDIIIQTVEWLLLRFIVWVALFLWLRAFSDKLSENAKGLAMWMDEGNNTDRMTVRK